MVRLFRSLKSEWLPATGYVSLREAKRDISYYQMITTTGGVNINTMTGYHQQKSRIGLIKIKCPVLVDHYKPSPGVAAVAVQHGLQIHLANP